MPQPLRDRDWKTLLSRIERGRCTPIIGQDAVAEGQPSRVDIAGQWARKYDYPLVGNLDLAQVAQFVAVQMGDPLVPKEEILDLIRQAPPFDPNIPNTIQRTLARLPFPVYITTNYNNAMTRALEAEGKEPRRELCRWNRLLRDWASVFDAEEGFEPDPSNPVIYHLYGSDESPESLVVTEDDHLDYLTDISKSNHAVLPPRIRRALAEPSLLLIGHRLETLAFRVLFRGLLHAIQGLGRTLNLAVQLPPNSEILVEYLEIYFEDFADLRVKIYWGDLTDFAEELDIRWREFNEQ